MTKRWRLVGCISIPVVVLLAAVCLLNFETSSPSASIAFLKGVPRKQSRKLYTVNTFSLVRGAVSVKPEQRELVRSTDTFTFKEPFEEIARRAKAELGPKAPRTQSNGNVTFYSIRDPKGTNQEIEVEVDQAGRSVTVIQYRPASWVDRSRDWVYHLFKPKEEESPGNVYMVK